MYDLELDTGPLEAFAASVQQHYADLAARLEEVADERPEDRIYMWVRHAESLLAALSARERRRR